MRIDARPFYRGEVTKQIAVVFGVSSMGQGDYFLRRIRHEQFLTRDANALAFVLRVDFGKAR
jgi:hypothetical protein